MDLISTLIAKQKPTTIPDNLHGKVQTGEVILDTGASHHMIGDVKLLSNV